MSFWTADNIKSVLGGAWLARDAANGAPLAGITTDSRAVRPGQFFLALKGDRTDGHEYLATAAGSGARMLIVHNQEKVPAALPKSVGVLLVPDTGAALLRLAAAYRKTLATTRVIAVGGSNGKTTTCKLLSAILSRTLRGTASPKSFNNAVGVPITILGAQRTDQYLICEVGTNAPGEIAPLAAVIEPDIAVITSVGREHLEGLGSLKGVVQEEAALIAALRPGGLAVINADAPMLVEAVRPFLNASAPGQKAKALVTFGASPAADLRITSAVCSPSGVVFQLNERERYQLPLLGRHNAGNAAAAIAVARRMGITTPEIEAGLASAKGPEMRMERSDVGGVAFVNDAYNANPESALAAIDTFTSVYRNAPGVSRRVMVLGEMLELGEQAPDLHREVGDAIAKAGVFDLVVLVGQLAMYAGERLSRSLPPDRVAPFSNAEGANATEIARLLRPGDAVLLKGSRRVGLEKIIAAAKHAAQAQTPPSVTIVETAPVASAACSSGSAQQGLFKSEH